MKTMFVLKNPGQVVNLTHKHVIPVTSFLHSFSCQSSTSCKSSATSASLGIHRFTGKNPVERHNNFLSSTVNSLFSTSSDVHRWQSPRKSRRYFREESSDLLKTYNSWVKSYERKIQATKKIFSCANLVEKSPPVVQPYLKLMRMDKPIGTLLLYFPCVYSICLATPYGHLPSFYYLALFGVGSVLMRGAGCIINDLWDRDLDKKVERTMTRPIASGQVSVDNAVKLLAGVLTTSLGILLSLNEKCIVIGCVGMIPVVLYPLAKRFTFFPQAVLGLTFNLGAVMGYTAVTGTFNWPLQSVLYVSCFLWTMYYDTIYALQDVDDDKKAGIKSTARWLLEYDGDLMQKSIHDRFDEITKRKHRLQMFLISCGGAHVLLMACAAKMQNLGGVVDLALFIIIFRVLFQASEIASVDCVREDYWRAFDSQRWLGFLFAAAFATSVYCYHESW